MYFLCHSLCKGKINRNCYETMTAVFCRGKNPSDIIWSNGYDVLWNGIRNEIWTKYSSKEEVCSSTLLLMWQMTQCAWLFNKALSIQLSWNPWTLWEAPPKMLKLSLTAFCFLNVKDLRDVKQLLFCCFTLLYTKGSYHRFVWIRKFNNSSLNYLFIWYYALPFIFPCSWVNNANIKIFHFWLWSSLKSYCPRVVTSP